MRINKYFVTYSLALLISIILLSIYFGLREVDQRLSRKINDLKIKSIKVNNIENKVNSLIDYVREKGIKIYNENEALQIVLDKADSLIKLYDASLKDDIKKEDGYYSVLLGFEYYPDSSEELFSLLISLKDQISPVVAVKKLKIENLDEGTKVYLEVQLIQPFLKGN